MLERAKQTYALWLPIKRNMPREERFGIGEKIDVLILDTLDSLRIATYATGEAKLSALTNAALRVDGLRFFIQLAWETKLVASTPYTTIGKNIEELGRMIGGWRKGLVSKTLAPTSAREK